VAPAGYRRLGARVGPWQGLARLAGRGVARHAMARPAIRKRKVRARSYEVGRPLRRRPSAHGAIGVQPESVRGAAWPLPPPGNLLGKSRLSQSRRCCCSTSFGRSCWATCRPDAGAVSLFCEAKTADGAGRRRFVGRNGRPRRLNHVNRCAMQMPRECRHRQRHGRDRDQCKNQFHVALSIAARCGSGFGCELPSVLWPQPSSINPALNTLDCCS
jgi:hypothetical protein